MDNEQNNSESRPMIDTGGLDKRQITIAILIGIGIFLAILIALGLVSSRDGSPTTTNVSAEKLDPVAGLPAGLPVPALSENDVIVESYKVSYPDKGAVLYTASYASSDEKGVVYDRYLEYMTSEGYSFERGAANPDEGLLYGMKSGNTLSVTVSDQAGEVVVNLSYLDR